MDRFETLLAAHRTILERFLRFRLPCIADADDVMQEVCLTAYRKFDQLKDPSAFKPWILTIARNKCNDFFRRQAIRMEIPIDELHESKLSYSFGGYTLLDTVSETLHKLGDKDKQILYLYYFKNLPQSEIAARLQIPLGTVKRRLHDAKQHFKTQYPYQPEERKDESTMKKLPERLPEYTITAQDEKPFAVKHEELPGMFIIPREGENVTFGMYDAKSCKKDGVYTLSSIGKVMIHGIEGVEISSEYRSENEKEDAVIFAQLTDTHCRYLGGIVKKSDGTCVYRTFLDEDFSDAYGIGENNCGFVTDREHKGVIHTTDDGLSAPSNEDCSDIVGRYIVTISKKQYDTVRLIDIQTGSLGTMLTEYYIDANGRTILWRRFNRDNWAFSRYGQLWSEKHPENERITVNGETYVHWYDCITDYIL